MEKIEYLSKYHNLLEKIDKLKDYIKFCDQRANSVSTVCFDADRIDGTKNLNALFVKWIERKVDAESKLEKLEIEANIKKVEIEETVSKINDSCLQMVLIYRYIDWRKWEDIAYMCHCSIDTCYRWHKQALDSIVIDEILINSSG